MIAAKPTASIRVACRPLNQNDAEVQEIKRDDDEYDQIMTTKHINTTPDPDDKTKVLQLKNSFHLLMEAIPLDNKSGKTSSILVFA